MHFQLIIVLLLSFNNLLFIGSINSSNSRQFGCNQNEFECKSDNICIPIDKVQDGVIDCSDASDEKCRTDQFKCRCGLPKCIDRRLVGNGVIECRDGSDEGQQLPCHQKKHRKKPSGDALTTNPTKLQLLHKESISSVPAMPAIPAISAPKLSHTHIIGSLSSGQVSHSTPNTILVSQQMFDKQNNNDLNRLYRESEHSIESIQSIPPKLSAPTFVELTGTFVPFEQLSSRAGLAGLSGVTAINYYPIDAIHRTHDSLIEITGTFVPEMLSTLINSTNHSYSHKDSDLKPSENSNPNKINFITISANKQTFVSQQNTWVLMTGSYVVNKTSYSFLFSNRQNNGSNIASTGLNASTRTKVSIYESNVKQKNNSVVVGLDGEELAVIVPTNVYQGFDKRNNFTNNRLLYATTETDGQIITGFFIEAIDEISVFGSQKPILKSNEPNISVLMITLDKQKPENVLIKQKFRETKPIVRTTAKPMESKYISLEKNNSSKNIDSRPQAQAVVGRKIEDGEVSILTDQFITTERTDVLTKSTSISSPNDYISPNKKISAESTASKVTPVFNIDALLMKTAPVYTHSKIDQNKKTQDINEDINKVKHKTTIFGFIDFTTTINNTEVVFMPASKGIPNPNKIHIKSTKLDLNTKQTTQTNSNLKSKEQNFKSWFVSTTKASLYENLKTISDEIKPTKTQTIPKSVLISNVFNNRQRNPNKDNFETINAIYKSKQSISETVSKDSLKQSISLSSRVTQSLSSSVENRVIPTVESSLTSSELRLPTGLLSTITGSNEMEGTVTEWTTSVIGTYIKGTYAHILQSTSSIYPKLTLNNWDQKIVPTKTAQVIPLETTRDDIFNPKQLNSLSNNEEKPQVFVSGSFNLESGMNDLSSNHPIYTSTQLTQSTRLTITNDFILPTLKRSPQFADSSKATPVLESIGSEGTTELKSIENNLNTFYTTYTYLTTQTKNGSTLIESRFETQTNVETASQRPELKPKTYYTKSTFYTTLVKEGQTLVNSHVETSSNVILEAIIDSHPVIPTRPVTTYFTTYTYFTTFRKGDTEFVKSREEIITNVMQNTIDVSIADTTSDPSVPQFASNSLRPTKTEDLKLDLTTLTYLTTNFRDGRPSVKSRKIVITKTIDSNQRSSESVNLNEVPELESSHSSKDLSVTTPIEGSLISSLNIGDLLSGLAVPITHYTTFTYYTTFFRDQTSSVISRTQVISNVKTGTINWGLKSSLLSITPTVNTFDISKTKTNDLGSIRVDTESDQLIAAGAENRPIVITPVTRLTTTTYFTTLLIPGEDSTVVSSTQVLSSIFLPEPSDVLPVPYRQFDYHHMSLDPSMTERHEGIVIHSTVDNRIFATESPANPGVHNPETVYTTYTYITTRFTNGFPIIDTSYETFSNIITKTITIPPSEEMTHLVETQPLEDLNSRTLRTTFTFLTTRYTNGTAFVEESKSTVTNALLNTLQDTQSNPSSAITPSRTRRPIVITRTRAFGSGTQPIISGSRRPVVIVRKRPEPEIPRNIPLRISGQFRSDNREGREGIEPHIRIVPPEESFGHNHNHFHHFNQSDDVGRRYPRVTPTPVTFYTTYTYFTTELLDGKPVIKSREQLYSTVITDKVLPTRTIPVDAVRHKRSAVFDQNYYKDITNKTIEDSMNGKQDLNTRRMEIQSIDSSHKTDSNELLSNIKTQSLMKSMSNKENDLKDPTETGSVGSVDSKSDHKIGIISEKTEVKGFQTIITEIYGTLINNFYAQFAVTRTLLQSNPSEHTLQTKQIHSLSHSLSKQLNSISSENETKTQSKDNSEDIKPSSISPLEMSSSLTWLSIIDLSDITNNIENTILPSIESSEPQMKTESSENMSYSSADTSSTSDTLSATPTPTPTLSLILFKTGLLSSKMETKVIENKTTLITHETYGTYINGIYAHLAKTRTQLLSNPSTLTTSPETLFSTLSPSSTDTNNIPMPSVGVISNNIDNKSAALLSQTTQTLIDEKVDQKSAQIISPTNIETIVQNGTTRTLSTLYNSNKTTIYTTDIISTTINGLLAHIRQVSSTVIEPWTSMPGLASAVTSTQVLEERTTLYTTEFYTTEINGFTAHYSRSTSNVMKSIVESDTQSEVTENQTFEKSKSLRPFIHFPTPVRFLFSSKMTTSSVPVSIITITSTVNQDLPSTEIPLNNIPDNKLGVDYGNSYESDEYYDESSERGEEHTPRSRPIREKDSQPLLEYEYEDIEPSPPTTEPPKPQTIPIVYRGVNRPGILGQTRPKARQVPLTRQANTQSARRVSGGFGQRVGINTNPESRQDYPIDYPELRDQIPVPQELPVQRQTRQRVMSSITRQRRPVNTRPTIAPTRPLEPTIPEYRTVNRESRQEVTEYKNNRPEEYQNNRRQQNMNTNRFTTRRRLSQITTPSPRTHPVLPNRGHVRLNRKYSGRPRYSTSTVTPTRDYYLDESTRYRNENNYNPNQRRTQQRGRAPKTTVLFLNKPSSSRYTEEYYSPTSDSVATPALPKVPVTVTSIVTTVKTIPIFHGYKTSYATLTTTTLNSSVIQTEQYETSVDPNDGITKSIFTQSRDPLEPTKLTEVLITTSVLYETKLIPIRIGFSTRTQTLTDVKTLTILTTQVKSVANPLLEGQSLLAPAGLSYSLFTSTNSFITTQTLTTTTVVSLTVRDETILSTLTLTSLTESTVTTTQTISIPVPVRQPVPQPITTLLTLTLTGDGGDITEYITAVTVPIQPVFHTKVERDVKATLSALMQQTVQTSDTFDYISASFRTVDQMIPTFDPLFISTIFKGPETEIYEASATVVKKHKKDDIHKNKKKVSEDKDKDKYETTFKKRKLQQLVANDNNYGYPFRNIDYSTVTLRPQTISLQVDQNEPIPDFLGFDSPRFQSLPQPVPQPVIQRNPTSRQPSFQRIRINKPLSQSQPFPTTPPTSLSSPNDPQSLRFQRVIGLDRLPEPNSPVRLTTQGGFRRVPVFNNQIPALPSRDMRDNMRPTIIEPTVTDVYATSILLSPTFGPLSDERPTFRRVRPQTQPQNVPNARRIKPKVKVSSRRPISTPLPTSVRVSSIELPFLPVSDVIDIPRRGPITRRPVLENEGTPSPPLIISSRVRLTTPMSIRDTTTDSPRRVVRIRRPNSSTNKKRISPKNPQSLANELQARGPVPPRDDEPSKNNALDGDDFNFNTNFGTRLNENGDKSNEIQTPTLPLTYFTTFTYLTTVVRGQHTAHLTRESITSSVTTEALDKSIVDLIQNSDGIINPTKVVELGTKTKGVTTTIVNLVSRIKVFNDDLYKVIHSTKPLSIDTKSTDTKTQSIRSTGITREAIKPTSVRKEVLNSKSIESNYKISDLESKPKKQITSFTYYYTLYDKLNTKYSTRSEAVTSDVAPSGISTLKLDSTINSEGLLKVGTGSETVHLGSRELGGLTTEVNLALNTYIKFNDINNAVVEPSATQLPDLSSQSVTPVSDKSLQSSLLSGSFATVPISDQISGISTPSIPLDTEIKLQTSHTSHTRKPLKLMSSAVVIRDPLRSKFDAINGRPGVRVRVKPFSETKKSILLSSSKFDEMSSKLSELDISSTPSFTSTESSSEEMTKDVIPSKKRIAVTLRRPFGGISRVSTRKPQRVSMSTKPRFVVVTRTGPLPTVQSTARVKISSRVFKSPVVSVEFTSSPSDESIQPSTTINENGETVKLEVTTIPVIFGLDTSYRTVTLTSTLTSSTIPLPTPVTILETTTHTVPFTVGDHTIYTTVEETNSRLVTQTYDSVDPSDAARANRFMKVSNGVTLIVGDNVLTNRTTSPVTLQPTLITGAAVHMKDGIKAESKQSSDLKSSSLTTLFDTRTLYTTFTYFTTFYTDDTSVISSSEQTVSNVVTIPYTHIVPTSSQSLSPTVVYETSDRLRTETVYSTFTYFATLFNGSTSTITPLEEIKTEYFTVKEPITRTRTIVPTTTEQASIFTRTYFTTYTNLVTFFADNKPVTSTIEETVSSEVVYTVPKSDSSSSTSSSSLVRATPALESPVLQTRSTYTTLTHYITLYSGSQTILSSIEEISPTVVTEISGQTLEPTNDYIPNIRFTQPSQTVTKQSKNLLSALVQSISTLFTTHTYFTTLFSGSTSTVISRKDTTSSLVTLYVPQSLAVLSTQSPIQSEYTIEATPTISASDGVTDSDFDDQSSKSSSIKSIQPSLRIDSSSYEVVDSSIISKVFEDLRSSEGLTEEQLSSVVAEVGGSTTIIDGSTIVFFTNFILPSTASDGTVMSTEANNVAKGPAGDLVSSLLNNADMSLLNELLASRISSVRASGTASPVYLTPHMTSGSASQPTAIKPGAVIELSDLLDGANLAGNIGEAIKDIVHILAKAPKGKNGTQDVDRISPSKELPPREGVAVSNSQDPVYIPLGAVHKPSVVEAYHQNDRNTKQIQNINTRRIQIIPSSTKGLDGSTTYGINTYNGFDAIPVESSLETTQRVLNPSFENQKPTPILMSKAIKTAVSRVSSGATTIFFTDSTQNAAKMPSFVDSNTPTESTKYVTSVESTTRTLTLTTTKVYYTRDSPLTITSVLTTTIPPRTFVSTIIGSRTILGTAGETHTDAVQPTQVVKGNLATTVTTTTLVHNSMTTTIVRTLVIPTATKSTTVSDTRLPFQRPRKPGTGPFRAPTRAPETPKHLKTSAPRQRTPYKPPPPQPPILSGVNESPFVPNKRPTMATTPKTTTRPSILDIDQCKPACNAANKEICKEMDGKYRCDCRQGFIRKNDDLICQELQNYVVVVRVMKVGESEVTWFSEYSNNSSDEYQNLAKMAKKQVDSAYMSTDVKEAYVGADVLTIDKVSDGGNGVLVNLTVRLTKRNNLDEDILREKLIKKLEQNSEELPDPQSVSADLEDFIDFDECSSDQYNDCAVSARCVNEPGSYRCECLNGYPDLDISLPGRVCASEIKGCEFCHGRGDCIRDESGQSNQCKCHRMYLGRRCEINGLLLAILLPIAAILCIVSICCIVYCCRKWRKRTISKGFRNLSSFGPTVIGGTLDRKAMLETSSESSDHLRSHVYDGPGILPNDPNGSDSHRRRESEPSLDRSMGSVGGPYTSLPPQIVIPRARHSSQQGFYTPETQDCMKYQSFVDNAVQERVQMPDRYSFDNRKRFDEMQTSSKLSTKYKNKYGKRSDLRREDDSKSVNSIKSSSAVSRRLSSYVNESRDLSKENPRQVFDKYDWDWRSTQKQRHYDYHIRPKSESELRNTISETGRSFEEIISRPPTHRLRDDMTVQSCHIKRTEFDESDVCEGVEYEQGHRKQFKNDLFSLNSTMTSQQQNCFKNNDNQFKLFF